MADVARAGVLVYARDLARVAAFYRDVLALAIRRADDDHQVLASVDIEVTVHAIPEVVGSTIEITTPPVVRESAAITPYFVVESLAAARDAAHRLGGAVFEEEWDGPGYRARHGYDPEGNVLQLREPRP
jgi:predicted enzyme related to lactoylglutathione lyase